MTSDPTPPPLPLAGIRVLDIANVLGAPVAATLLAEFGADQREGGRRNSRITQKIGLQ